MAYCSNCGQQLSDGANFCANCGVQVRPIASNIPQRQTVFEGQMRKCPNCGEVLNALSDSCPSCGYVFRGVAAISSAKELSLKLEQIDRERPQPNRWGRVTDEMYNRFEKAQSEKKAAIIRSFPIPNTREDLWEFLLMTSTSIDTTNDCVSKAWTAKFEQVYNKAEIIFGDSEELNKVKQLRESYRKKKVKRILKSVLIPFLPFVPLVIMWIFLFFFTRHGDKRTNDVMVPPLPANEIVICEIQTEQWDVSEMSNLGK